MPEMKYKRKKNVRYQGSKTHGGGSMKKRRGAGHRGGRGNAGSGKRGDVKKPSFIKAGRRFGRYGFVTPSVVHASVVNVGDIQRDITNRIDNRGQKAQEQYEINLTAQKVDKLLGTGEVKTKLVITVASASPSAIKKVEAAGGKVILPQ
jgi:large subunit ribosomal protein L15